MCHTRAERPLLDLLLRRRSFFGCAGRGGGLLCGALLLSFRCRVRYYRRSRKARFSSQFPQRRAYGLSRRGQSAFGCPRFFRYGCHRSVEASLAAPPASLHFYFIRERGLKRADKSADGGDAANRRQPTAVISWSWVRQVRTSENDRCPGGHSGLRQSPTSQPPTRLLSE